ncbi:unnamed protein product [Gongylonema pulchrum]|uniref:MPN domain-containing protein n=1 Tax=Gongylonema pulchrum TaxID=637853 RepID=A0A183EBL8_9BILA|nr:unnamed protein product [Gongylonema pulchrum]
MIAPACLSDPIRDLPVALIHCRAAVPTSTLQVEDLVKGVACGITIKGDAIRGVYTVDLKEVPKVENETGTATQYQSEVLEMYYQMIRDIYENQWKTTLAMESMNIANRLVAMDSRGQSHLPLFPMQQQFPVIPPSLFPLMASSMLFPQLPMTMPPFTLVPPQYHPVMPSLSALLSAQLSMLPAQLAMMASQQPQLPVVLPPFALPPQHLPIMPQITAPPAAAAAAAQTSVQAAQIPAQPPVQAPVQPAHKKLPSIRSPTLPPSRNTAPERNESYGALESNRTGARKSNCFRTHKFQEKGSHRPTNEWHVGNTSSPKVSSSAAKNKKRGALTTTVGGDDRKGKMQKVRLTSWEKKPAVLHRRDSSEECLIVCSYPYKMFGKVIGVQRHHRDGEYRVCVGNTLLASITFKAVGI